MRLTKAEQETIILFNEAEQTASVYTHNAALLHQLERLRRSHPAQVHQTERGGHGGADYLLPKKWAPDALSGSGAGAGGDERQKPQAQGEPVNQWGGGSTFAAPLFP